MLFFFHSLEMSRQYYKSNNYIKINMWSPLYFFLTTQYFEILECKENTTRIITRNEWHNTNKQQFL